MEFTLSNATTDLKKKNFKKRDYIRTKIACISNQITFPALLLDDYNIYEHKLWTSPFSLVPAALSQ